MAQGIASPVGLFSDEEAGISPVLESTAAECGLRRALLPDFSAISADQEQTVFRDNGKVKVYARVRPLKPTEIEKHEDQGCVCIENADALLLKAPRDSFTMRNTERGIGQAVHKFTFSQIFGPEIGQKAFFDATMKEVVKDVLNGQNWLVYTYGVTNSGKTYTIQGDGTNRGILPRSLAIIFNSIGTRLYRATDLKPFLSNIVNWLDSKQSHQEEAKKQALIYGGTKEEVLCSSLRKSHRTGSQSQAPTSGSIDSGIGLSSVCQSTNQTNWSQLEEIGTDKIDPQDYVSFVTQEDVQFSIWVSFFEIYNELIYDLLETPASAPNRKRPPLRLCEDHTGNTYVKDLNWVNVQNAEEAWKLLKLGRRNQSFASTHMNENSSRSHSIFSIRILHLQERSSKTISKISELSLCDLAGSERCKEQRTGDRMKEANNINTSLHTLGRCLTILRHNQTKSKQNVVPFRDSKLTRVFQGFFTGHGQSCMIVNINPCASSYDETLHVAKFSAIASQLIQVPTKVGLLSIHSLVKEHSIQTSNASVSVLDEETESDEDSEDEIDVAAYDKEDLVHIVEAVQQLLLKERREKLQLEVRLRDEICNEMMTHLQQRDQWSSDHMDSQKELLEELYEDKLNNLKVLLTDYYLEEIENRDDKIKELEVALQEAKQENSKADKRQDMEEPSRRSTRITSMQHELQEVKYTLEKCQAELSTSTKELLKYRKMLEPPPSARPIAADLDRKLGEGQKNVRMLRSELLNLGELFQSAERACCHRTSAGKLREALNKCDSILVKQDQTLAELQNNMILVKLDMRRKAACIAEQYQTVQKLQAAAHVAAPASMKKRFSANNENLQPKSQPPIKKPFLHNFLTRTVAQPAATESPYTRILRARGTPEFKPMPFSKKY
ncbi:kinesin-like protein KIF20A [Pantherophis guttatus]|uniref:Kinesin-like protein n=1 Tax=Pantherophis guttatus TaxID=94885 RepID=A0A6P9DPT4_PANGU|nr:kinesin-like protein KIF20A [Pantherophis guttatus]XP_034297573.1 kinesin-like protein KIF20A [Pantherophis guttatus]